MMANPERNIVSCCPWRPGHRGENRSTLPGQQNGFHSSLQLNTCQNLSRLVCVLFSVSFLFPRYWLKWEKVTVSWSPLLVTMLLSFQACAPKGCLGHSQKTNGLLKGSLFLFFLTLVAQTLPITGLLQVIYCWSKYSWCLWCVKIWMLKIWCVKICTSHSA